MAGDPVRIEAQTSTPPVTITVQSYPLAAPVPATTTTYVSTVTTTELPLTITPTPPMVIDQAKPVLTNTTILIGSGLSCNPSTSSIVQDCQLRASSFEQNVVNFWLGYHGLPQSDAPLLYQYATADVRAQIRSLMFANIQSVISEATPRSASDQALYNWISQAVQKNQIAYYAAFTAEYNRWRANTCGFQLNPVVAKAFGLTYDGAAFCSIGGIFQTPSLRIFRISTRLLRSTATTAPSPVQISRQHKSSCRLSRI